MSPSANPLSVVTPVAANKESFRELSWLAQLDVEHDEAPQMTSNTWATTCNSILDPENCRTTAVTGGNADDFARLRTSSMTNSLTADNLMSCSGNWLRGTLSRHPPRLQ